MTTQAKAEAFAEEHKCRYVATAREAAAHAEVFITCLPSSREVHALMKGADGISAGVKRGTLLIDCTSGDPATSILVAEELKALGAGFVDAPVSGQEDGVCVIPARLAADIVRALEPGAVQIETPDSASHRCCRSACANR